MSSDPARSETDLSDRFRGCLLGGAIGDALGYPIEFVRDTARLDVDVPVDLVLQGDGLAVVSDDTQMTLFCAEGLIRTYQRMHDRGIGSGEGVLAYAFDRWLATQVGLDVPMRRPGQEGWLLHERRLHHRRAPGNTCLSALEAARAGRPVKNKSKGCGAVMRSAPIGLVGESPGWSFELARDSGQTTHQHPSGYLSAAAFASIVQQVARGVGLGPAVEVALEQLAAELGHEETSAALTGAMAASGALTRREVERLGEGWTGEEALAMAVRCARLADEDPERVGEALWRSVAHVGDSDSTGSLTGNLLGARHGVVGLPERWCSQVELYLVIRRLAGDLYAAGVAGQELGVEDYPPC